MPTGATSVVVGFVAAATGGVVSLPDGSSIAFGQNYFVQDQYVQLAEVPSASVSGENVQFSSLPGTLQYTFVAANASGASHLRSSRAALALPAAGTATLVYAPPVSTAAAIDAQSIPFVDVTAAGGNFTYANPPSFSTATGLETTTLPSNILAMSSGIFGIIQPIVAKLRGCAPLGVKFFDRATHTWNAGAPPKRFYHPLLVLHGIFSCTEKAFNAGADLSLDRITEDGAYDAVIGYTYDWTQTPDTLIPLMAADLNGVIGNVRHLDILAHSYGCIMAIGVIPLLQAQSVDNLTLIGGPLNGSYLANNNFLFSYFTSPAGFSASALLPFLPPLFVGAVTFNFAGSDWRSTFIAGSPRVQKLEAMLSSAPNAPLRIYLVAGTTSPFAIQNLLTSIFSGPKEANDGIVAQSSAWYPLSPSLRHQENANVTPGFLTLLEPQASHFSETQDRQLELDIAGLLSFEFSNTDPDTTQFASSQPFVVFKAGGPVSGQSMPGGIRNFPYGDSTDYVNFQGIGGGTVTANQQTVASSVFQVGTMTTTVQPPGSAVGDRSGIPLMLINASMPTEAFDPDAFETSSATNVVSFDLNRSGTIVPDAFDIKLFAVPFVSSALTPPSKILSLSRNPSNLSSHLNVDLEALDGISH